ncbi:MAG TPA: O-antigen ligase family protein [Candidatus Sulfotelmatobacter sp.]|nr:O-antigen ligase family protein [Candidatus Sulfotelmatobacter sp.]
MVQTSKSGQNVLLICFINVMVVAGLIFFTIRGGLERALPFALFAVVLAPGECRIGMGLFDLTTQRVVVLTLAALFLSFPVETKGSLRGRTVPFKWIMLVSIVWSVVAAVNSIVPIASFKSVLSLVLDYYLLYLICWKSITRVETIRNIMTAMVAALGVCCVFGILEEYRQWSVKSLFPIQIHLFNAGGVLLFDDERGLRITSTFGHAILFGAALAIGIPIALYLLSVAKRFWERVFLWISILLMSLNIYKTVSRGPWLGLTIALVLLLLLGQGKLKKQVLIVGAIAITVLVARPGIWGTVKGIYANSSDTNTTTGSSYEYRYGLTRAAIRAVGKDFSRMAWGYGQGSAYYLGLQGEMGGVPHTFLSCDSTWVGLLLDSGYIGLAIFATLFVKAAFVTWRNSRRKSTIDRNLSVVLFINLITYYFIMTSVALFDQNWYILWMLIAAALVHGRLKRSSRMPHDAQLHTCLEPEPAGLGALD